MKAIIHVVEDEKHLNDLVKSYLEAEGYEWIKQELGIENTDAVTEEA